MEDFNFDVRAIRDQAPWIKEVMSAKPPGTREELRSLIYTMAGAHYSLLHIGGSKADVQKTGKIVSHLLGACTRLSESLATSDLRQYPEWARAIYLLDKHSRAFREFLKGSHWASVTPDDYDLPATLPAGDVRSRTRALEGMADYFSRQTHVPDPELVAQYRACSLAGPDTAAFLAYGVPAQSAEYYLNQFSPQEYKDGTDAITSGLVAAALSTDPFDAGYVEFLAVLVKEKLTVREQRVMKKDEFAALYPDLDWEAEQYPASVLFDELDGTPTEKVDFIRQNRNTHFVSMSDMLHLVKIDGFSQQDFDAACAKYEGAFAPDEIIAIKEAGCDLDEAKALYDSLLDIMRYPPFIIELLTSRKGYDKALLAEFASNFDPHEAEDMFTIGMVPWFFDNNAKAKQDIALLRGSGIKTFGAVYELSTDADIPAAYWGGVITVLGTEFFTDEERQTLKEWHAAGITPADIERSSGLWDTEKGVPWHVCGAANMKAYLGVLDDPGKVEIMGYVCEKHDKVPSEIAEFVDEGYTKAEFDEIERLGLLQGWLKVIHAYPSFGPAFEKLDDDEKFALLSAKTPAILAELGKTADASDAIKNLITVQAPVDEKHIPPIDLGYDDAYKPHLEKLEKRHKEYIALFRLFGITPDYMADKMALSARERALSDTVVNHIIMRAYVENLLAPHLVPLIERYKIEQFTRYPADVLESMAVGHEGDTHERVTVFLNAKTDHNSSQDDQTRHLSTMAKHSRVYVYEITDKKDFHTAIREVGEELAKQGKKISLVCYRGHSDHEFLQIGYPYSRSSTELSRKSVEFLAPLRRFLSDDAQMLLASCSTMKGEHNIGKDFARAWRGVQVFGATAITGLNEVEYGEDDRLKKVEFHDKDVATDVLIA